RERIERDVLLEGAYLAVCDPAINNKSVGNRTGAAVVGMCVGHPELVRFGLDGFRRTVEEWFLPDGGTSESAAYALMTMSGVRDFALLLRDYTEPEGYVGPDGRRVEHFNACRDTRYGDCWQSLIWTLQGDLRYPPSADSYKSTALGASFAELIALAYPTPEHLALLKECAGTDAPASPAQAIFYREPGIEKRETPPLSLPDVVFPFLLQGHLRTGPLGRDSLALLSAREWGNHHHMDSLDLYYWASGRELLSDLGYLWDHPDKYQTARTFAHNTLLLDGRDQITRGREGSFHLFGITPHVKIMEASARAYEAASVYRRTVVQIDHGESGSYLVDFFRAQGGAERQYLFHGPNNIFQVEGLDLTSAEEEGSRPVAFALRFHLSQVSEIFVSDVEVVPVLAEGQEGPNLAPPIPAGMPDGAKPAGWGAYSGDGECEWGATTVDGGPCIRFRAVKPHANGRMNVALLVGDSDGYTGARALRGKPGATYRVRFRLRGNASNVSVGAITWPYNPDSPADRVTVSAAQVSAETGWKTHQATFTLPASSLPLRNIRRASGTGPWRASWQVDEEYTFCAFSPGGEGEKVLLGDGWGQRDHRNTDRGATLPYLLRIRTGKQLDTFVSVFAGAPAQRPLVKGVRRLALPAGAPPDAVLLEVQTALGSDVVYSTLSPALVRADTPLGEMVTDGAAAVVLSGPGGAALFGGTRLSVGRVALSLPRATWSGKVAGASSEAGNSWFRLEGALPPAEALAGQTLFVTAEGKRRAYPIRRVEGNRVYTKWSNVGFEARGGETWEVVSQAAWQG
ncbi:MAG: heparinase II/III family protein, partial [Armatimonadota bacterium]|nr:heparinase II/III family protein [Armatimonadota bacterium]